MRATNTGFAGGHHFNTRQNQLLQQIRKLNDAGASSARHHNPPSSTER